MTGDFGQSLVSSRPVTEILAPRIFNTVAAFDLRLPALSAADRAARASSRRSAATSRVDHALSVVTLVLLSMPDFLLATILLFLFVVRVPVLPGDLAGRSQLDARCDYLWATTLPALTLAIVMAVYAVRMLRDNLIEVLDSDYIRMAELKGLSARRVLLRHALPNALVPTLERDRAQPRLSGGRRGGGGEGVLLSRLRQPAGGFAAAP